MEHKKFVWNNKHNPKFRFIAATEGASLPIWLQMSLIMRIQKWLQNGCKKNAKSLVKKYELPTFEVSNNNDRDNNVYSL